MKVRDMRSDRKVKFEEIPVGTVIKLKSGLWIKVKPFIPADDTNNKFARDLPMNLVRLEDGLFARELSDELVTPVDLEIEIYDYYPQSEDKR